MKSRFHLVVLAFVVITCPAYARGAFAQSGLGPPGDRQPPPPAPLIIEQSIDIPYAHGIYDPADQRYHQQILAAQFDPSSGARLRLVRVTFQSFLATDLVAENTDWVNGCLWSWWLQAHAALVLPTGTVFSHDMISEALRPWRLTKFDGTADGYGPSARRETRVATFPQVSVMLSGTEIDPFIGDDFAALDMQRWGLFAYSATTANGIGGHNRRIAGRLVIQYFVQ